MELSALPSSPISESARRGLEAVEDYTQVELRKSIIERRYTDPWNEDPMLVLVKGRRFIQIRLVEPHVSSLCSGDCYVLITPQNVYCWLGKYGNVIEKVKAKEVASKVCKRKEMGYQGGNPVVVIEEGVSAHETEFLECLGGGNKPYLKNETDDEVYESSICKTNRVYMLVDNELVLNEKYSGQKMKVELLQELEAVWVLDFGTEMYVWFGPKCAFEDREKGLNLAKDLWNRGVEYESGPNPFCPLGEENTTFKGKRPDWCIFGKINQNIETQLFKGKFFDWPESRRHSSSSSFDKENEERKEAARNSLREDSGPADVEKMLAPCDQEVTLLLEGTHVGRGRKWVDKHDDFFSREFDIVTSKVTCWHVQDNEHHMMDHDSHGQFHDSDTYVVRWEYIVTPSSVKSLRGGQARLSLTGRDRCAYFFWHGKSTSVNEKGASALMTVELDAERGPHVGVVQGLEPPSFTQLFNGNMIVYNGTRDGQNNKKWRLFALRNEILWEAYLLEVPCLYSSLRQRSSFFLVDTETGLAAVVHGSLSPSKTQDCMDEIARKLNSSCPKEMGLKRQLKLDIFGSKFYTAFEDYELSKSLSGMKLISSIDSSPRLFRFVSVSNVLQSKEVLNGCRSDYITPLPFMQEQIYDKSLQPALFLLDVGCKVYLWQGWWPDSFDRTQNVQIGGADPRFKLERKMALELTKEYYDRIGCDGEIVIAGYETREFIELFPRWEASSEAFANNADEYNRLNGAFDIDEILSRYPKHYTYNQLLEKPDGIDTSKLESYLCESEFTDVFKMNKEGFYQLPPWKQISLRKKAGLF